MSKLSANQRAIFAAVAKAAMAGPDAWYRAGQAGIGHPRGEAVTLASLCPRLLQRRAWRGQDGEPDAAYEYRLTKEAEDAVRTALAQGMHRSKA